ncbi:hypothetical protein ED312_23265 [Sinomicrobium pectinilyticum]|uniref:Lantibiotic dehydratase N-terminal domain-containing protein n=1 Tax=Sinomicrobium pectinilyticum TaxID=1084421 RepID=A0A3N0CYU6_SINP1|nr:lantibiotic dehydratase family protein [Sinomicrobium pectinilyticum]RNL68585.1 hypothetical protein ED312_23265 [Sinomicrobium pectinilyticum]
MKKRNIYSDYNKYILRTPLLSLNFFKNLTSEETISDERIKNILKDPTIREAIFLASPPLYKQIVRWENNQIKEEKKRNRLKTSILKYIFRMSTRPTPFGLFAGCAVGKFEDNTNIKLSNYKSNNRHTRLDMNYLVSLSQDLVQIQGIKEQLLFYPNTSLYSLGRQLRYVEYGYINGQRYHHIVAVKDSPYLSKILDRAKGGALLKDLSNLLVDDEITEQEASEFIYELVDNQLLISELEPSVTGPEFIEQIKNILQKLEGTSELLDVIERTQTKLKALDKTLSNPPQKYIEISKDLETLKTDFELKYLFQTDMFSKVEHNLLSASMVELIKDGLTFLNKITLPRENGFIDRFKAVFQERYEQKEVLLSKALDTELGVGYRQDQSSGEINPLINDLILPERNGSNDTRITLSPIHKILFNKITQAFSKELYVVKLRDDDFKEFEENWRDLPDSLWIKGTVGIIDGKEMVKLSVAGGSSGAKLIGRFCHGNDDINILAQEIIDKETLMNKDKILAEIVHLPESRVGNILLRPSFRQFEIPYLAKSNLSNGNQISLNELYVSVNYNGKVLLRSKRLGKEIIPKLTNAHSYWRKTLPIYHFLGDMQNQKVRPVLEMTLGPLVNEYKFIPRFEYKNIILQEAMWHLDKEDVKHLYNVIDDNIKLKEKIGQFKETKNIPQYISLLDGDNELLINLHNLDSVKVLLETVKNRNSFKIAEFLFMEDGIVKNEKGESFANEIIVPFYNSKKINDA